MAFAPSLNEALQVSDKQQFCRNLLEHNAKYTSVQIQKQAPIKIDNMNGYETIATATHRGRRVFVYLTVVFYDRSYYHGEGLVIADKQTVYEPVFRKMAMSLKRKTPNLN
jgi:hypothetical protein